MSNAEDLSGKYFGHLKVLERAADHITKSGQKKVRWLCECQLCGTLAIVGAQDLKTGNTTSCGCYKKLKGKMERHRKSCVICGKEFNSPPSDSTVTCSSKCRKEYAKIRRIGKVHSAETRNKMSKKAQGRDLSLLQSIGTEAAKQSPNSGRFVTNKNAIDWHLISPGGKHYRFRSLNLWLRENGLELFGCNPDSREYRNVKSGLCNAKRAALGKGSYNCCTYKGWQVIPTENDFKA